MPNKSYKSSTTMSLFTPLLLLALLLSPLTTYAAAVAVLSNCFNILGATYTSTVDAELPANENKDGNPVIAPTVMPGEGPIVTAHCECPKNLTSSTPIYEMTAAGSPLPPGVSGYAYLTEHLDIDVSGYANAISSPTGDSISILEVNTYPTPKDSSMSKYNEADKKAALGTYNVCNENTPGSIVPIDTPKRQFRWNMSRFTLYVKKSILGEEVIPPTVIIQNYSCLSTNNYCQTTDATLVSEVSMSGRITAPLSCIINAGSTIEVELGNIISSQFVSAGQVPSGYTLKDVDISYHCDTLTPADGDRIKLTLTADQGVTTASNLIAKMLGRDDIGVRMFDQNNSNTALDGSVDLPVTLDELGNGTIHMKAAPVSTTSTRPSPGKFEGNVTVKMDIR